MLRRCSVLILLATTLPAASQENVAFRTPPEEIRAEGGLSVDQAALGLEPFSVALGALRVRRDLDIDFRLRARPENPSPAGT